MSNAKWFKQMESLTGLDLVSALHQGAKVILTPMQRLTPVDTGELLESERIEDKKDEVWLIAGSDHAIYVEFGTYKMEAQPYMRPAVDTNKRRAVMEMRNDLWYQIRQAVK